MKARTVKKGIVTLCSSGGCCPEVDFTGKGVVIIRDDFGGRVMLTEKEWEQLVKIKKDEHK